jgi:serine/threonine protein kinase/formylglycine-generating enzyme required for sulfatase activity
MGSWSPPEEFDGYQLLSLIGRGGMGEVHLAVDTLLERQVAIKFISGQGVGSQARQRFLVEARAVAKLQHPNVVSIHRIGVVGAFPYIVSEFVKGIALNKLLGKLTVDQISGVASDIAGALASAHKRGIIHRDIKPANVILSENGTAKLLDFGIAKFVGLEAGPGSVEGELVSTPGADPEWDITPVDNAEMQARTDPLTGGPRDASTDETPVDLPSMDLTQKESISILDPGDSVASGLYGEAMAGSGVDLIGLTSPGMLMGSPRYMAPEIWAGEQATYRTDIYSFGALVFALCTGHPPHREKKLEVLARQVRQRNAPSLAALAPELDSGLAEIVDRCLKRKPAERFESGNAVRSALAAISRNQESGSLPEGNPYRGLRTFESEHSGLFFGRDSETRMILERFNQDPFVLVVGDSGIGKSSLCKAAVMPRLRAGKAENRTWTSISMIPGRRPAAALCDKLSELLGREPLEIQQLIAEGPGDLIRLIRSCQAAESGLILFVDQLEELLTISDPAERIRFCSILAMLCSSIPGIRVLATIRGDFLGKMANLEKIGDELTRAVYFLRPLSEERIREAIVAPAAAKGVEFESEALIQNLVDFTCESEGGLPLLQFALEELWDARAGQGCISASILEAMGGVGGALTKHADRVLAQMDDAGRRAAKGVMLALVRSDGTRLRKNGHELVACVPEARAAIDALIKGRLIIARENSGEYGFEIAHEALVSAWSTLSAWLADELGTRIARERLRHSSAEWLRLGKHAGLLWSPRQMREVQAVELQDLPEAERLFLTRSKRKRLHSILKRVGVLAGLPMLVALIVGVVLFRARLERKALVDNKVSRAHVLHETGLKKLEQADATRSEALQAFDKPELATAEKLWSAHLKTSDSVQRLLEEAGRMLETALLLDAERSDARRLFAKVLYQRALLAERSSKSDDVERLLKRLSLYDENGELSGAWARAASVSVKVEPDDANLVFERFEVTSAGRLRPVPVAAVEDDKGQRILPPGSYRLIASGPGRAKVALPFILSRGQSSRFNLHLPEMKSVPEGFVFVPEGRFLFGTAAEQSQRQQFYHTVPQHERWTASYLIAKYETTFGQWIDFLENQTEQQRLKLYPRVGSEGFQGSLSLSRLAEGNWQLSIKPTQESYLVRTGEKIVYRGRPSKTGQDWSRLPVVGISIDQARDYCRWLDDSGRLPGARLCTEMEWERAARGADEREFPHGYELLPSDSNHDQTYDKKPSSMGPDEVGSYPASVSPFGVFDLAGNVWEFTSSVQASDQVVARGGSFHFGANSCRSTDREVVEPSFRDVSVGFRVCADLDSIDSKSGNSAGSIVTSGSVATPQTYKH